MKCLNKIKNTYLDPSVCGATVDLTEDNTNFSANVSLPEESGKYQILIAYQDSFTGAVGDFSEISGEIDLDVTPPAPTAFSSCPTGICASTSDLASDGQTNILLSADEDGSIRILLEAVELKSSSVTAGTQISLPILASELGGTAGAYTLSVEFSDALGNKSQLYSVPLNIISAPTGTDFYVRKTRLSDNYLVNFSFSQSNATDTWTLTKKFSSTPSTTIVNVEKVAEGTLSTIELPLLIPGAESDAFPISFSVFVCTTMNICSHQTLVLDGSIDSFQNDSDGSNFTVDFTENSGGTSFIAYSDDKDLLLSWDGRGSAPSGISTVSVGDPTCTTPANGCSVDTSSFVPWQRHFGHLVKPSTDGKAFHFSELLYFARVPDGMVYVDQENWPDQQGLKYKTFERFSFAIDKYEATANGTVNDCSTDDSPCSGGIGGGHFESKSTGVPASTDWFTATEACKARPAPGFEYATNFGQIRLQTGREFIIAGYGTPTNWTQGFCANNGRTASAVAADAAGADDTSGCISYFGARNLNGNSHEWSNGINTGGPLTLFYDTSSPEFEEHQPFLQYGSNNSAQITNWESTASLPKEGLRAGPWDEQLVTNLKAYNNDNLTPLSIAPGRGAKFDDPDYGRFTMRFLDPSVDSAGGRCAISSPAPGKFQVQNSSEGDKLRFKWRMRSHPATTVRFAIAKLGSPDARSILNAWNGEEISGTSSDDIYTISDFTQCSDTDYGSNLYENDSGAVSSGSFGIQGRCGIDFSSFANWETRIIRGYAENAYGQLFSEDFIFGKVPDGMVFVSKHDWPDPERHRKAEEWNEMYTTPYDFALDKYKISMSTGDYCFNATIPCDNPAGAGAGYAVSSESTVGQAHSLSTMTLACERRNQVLGAGWIDSSTSFADPSGRRFRIPTNQEWMVGSFETPTSFGPGFCHGTVIAANNFATQSTEHCISRYGARNMFGHTQGEYVSDVIALSDSLEICRFYTSTGKCIGGVVSNTDLLYSGPYLNSWNWDGGFAESFSSSYGYERAGSTNFNSYFSAQNSDYFVVRGWTNAQSSEIGRFSILFSVTANASTARCALSAPTSP